MKARTVIGAILIIIGAYLVVISMILLLYGTPRIIGVDWGSPKAIETPLAPQWVRVVHANGTDHLLYSARNADDAEMSLYHMVRQGDGWSAPALVPLELSVSAYFDCVYNGDTGEFLVFFRHYAGLNYAIYISRGNLTQMGPPKVVAQNYLGEGSLGMGPSSMSAVMARDGTVYLFYCFITGRSEDLNDLYLTRSDGPNWTGAEFIGTGNGPAALEGKDGSIHLYSNLYTYAKGTQYCVQEWAHGGGKWKAVDIPTGAKDAWVTPFVTQDRNWTRYLLYEDDALPGSSRSNLLMQTQREGQSWSRYKVIVGSGIADAIRCPCATIVGGSIHVYFIQGGELRALDGDIGT